jgi:hypothetical protein
MKKLSVRVMFLTAALLIFAVPMVYGDTVVTFPSDNSYTCNVNACDFVGNLNHQSEPFFTSGDFVTEIFFNGPQTITGLSYDFKLLNDFGGNTGKSYANDIFVNGTQVGSFLVPDCNFCNSQQEYKGQLNFSPLEGDGTYALAIVLGVNVPANGGTETFLAPGSVDLVPEPGTLVLLGSGALAMAGAIRRKLWR